MYHMNLARNDRQHNFDYFNFESFTTSRSFASNLNFPLGFQPGLFLNFYFCVVWYHCAFLFIHFVRQFAFQLYLTHLYFNKFLLVQSLTLQVLYFYWTLFPTIVSRWIFQHVRIRLLGCRLGSCQRDVAFLLMNLELHLFCLADQLNNYQSNFNYRFRRTHLASFQIHFLVFRLPSKIIENLATNMKLHYRRHHSTQHHLASCRALSSLRQKDSCSFELFDPFSSDRSCTSYHQMIR